MKVLKGMASPRSSRTITIGAGLILVSALVLGAFAGGWTAASAQSGQSEMAVAAKTIGISETTLAAALGNSQTVAQVAQARGVNPQKVIDDVVKYVLTQAQSRPDWQKMSDTYKSRFTEQTRTRVTKWVYGTGTAGAAGEEQGTTAERPLNELEVAAKAIGVSSTSLSAEMRKGRSIAQVAQARGIAPQSVVDAVVRNALAKAQASAEWAKLSDAQKARFTEQTRTRVTKWVYGMGATGAAGEEQGTTAERPLNELEVAAKAIGVTSAALLSEIKKGQSIGQVAQALGVRPQMVIDAVVNHILAQAQSRPDWSKLSEAYKARFAEQTRARVSNWINNTSSTRGGRER